MIQYPEQNSPENFGKLHSKRLDNSVLHFNLKCNEETGILAVDECISADRNLHVRLSYHGLVLPLRQGLRYEKFGTFTKFSMLENFVSYLRVVFSRFLDLRGTTILVYSYLRNNKGDRSK